MNWKKVKLGEICDKIMSGGTPSTEIEEFWNGPIPWVSSADIAGNFTITPKKFITQKAKSNILPANNVLVVTRVGLGKVAINDIDLAFSQDIQGIVLKANVDNLYLLYCLSLKVQKFKTVSRGATIKGVTREDLVNLEIPLPDLATQKHIAAVLDKADALRQHNRQLLAHYDELLQSTFIELFGDPVKNPKGWEVKKLGEIVSKPTQNGLYVPKESYSSGKDGIEMVHMSDAFNGVIKRGNLKRVLIKANEVIKYSINHQDILIARRSLNYEGSAKPCLIPTAVEPLVFESSLIRIRAKENLILPIFLFSFLNNREAKKHYILKYVTQSTISGINNSNLNKIKILIPPLPLQQHFAKIVEQIEGQKEAVWQSLAESEALFEGLLAGYFGAS